MGRRDEVCLPDVYLIGETCLRVFEDSIAFIILGGREKRQHLGKEADFQIFFHLIISLVI